MARALAPHYGVLLPTDVETILESRRSQRPPDQFVDPVAIASLVVSAASLAWAIYADLVKGGRRPEADELRALLRDGLPEETDDEVVEVVAETTVSTGDDDSPLV